MFGLNRRASHSHRSLRSIAVRPDYVYAIGDVHGCLDLLLALEETIAADMATQRGNALVVYLGDYIDRGPASAGVLDHLIAQQDTQLVKLAGNHEDMFLAFFSEPTEQHPWLKYGGMETLRSYGLDAATLFEGGRRGAKARLASHIPEEHLEFMRALPACLGLPGLTLVHAGLKPSLPLDRQAVEDMTWLRLPKPAYTEAQPFGLLVHGHTPDVDPIIESYRVCVDTGAFATGVLTAARIDRSGAIRLFATGTRQPINR